jgi:hypothetical protein
MNTRVGTTHSTGPAPNGAPVNVSGMPEYPNLLKGNHADHLDVFG